MNGNTNITNESCITVKQLKEFLCNWPEYDPTINDDTEVWIDNMDGTSSPCVRVIKLNFGDILLERRN